MSRPLSIEFVSQVEGLEEIAPPVPAGRHAPNWLRAMSGAIGKGHGLTALGRSFRTASTIKRCPGVVDSLQTGYVIPLWADFHVRYDSTRSELEWSSPSPWARVSLHKPEQFEGTPLADLANPYTMIAKLESPWRIKAPKGYSTYFVDPVYHRDRSDFLVLPGIVDHDTFHVANVFVVWTRYGSGEVMLPRGLPLVQVLPFRREHMQMQVRSMGPGDVRDLRIEEVKMQGLRGYYRKFFWSRKEYR